MNISTSSAVTFLQGPVKKSTIKGSDGRNSFKNPKVHNISEIFIHSCMISYLCKFYKKKFEVMLNFCSLFKFSIKI